MALTAGMKLGPYVIESPLGAGGVGEVYRARDSRLHLMVEGTDEGSTPDHVNVVLNWFEELKSKVVAARR